MVNEDLTKRLEHEEEVLRWYWNEVKKHIRKDLANIWTDEVRLDFSKINRESSRIVFILKKLHSHYRVNSASFQNEIRDVKNLVHHLNKIEAKAEWVRQIHRDLNKIIADIEKEIQVVKSGGIGFTSTPWLSDKLQEVEKLKPSEQIEFYLPDDLDFRYFVAKLGEPSRRHELGGLYCPQTKSIVVVRGYAPSEINVFSDPKTPYLKPRKHDNGKFDDIFFHTHPWTPEDRIYRNPIDSCRPSGTDSNSILSTRMVEEEDVYERIITSLIGSRGFLSVTEAHGIKFDENLLYQIGLNPEQVAKIKERLSLEPPIWTPNFAKNDELRGDLLALARRFYHSRRVDRTKSYHQKVVEFKEAVKEIVYQGGLDKFINSIVGHLPQYTSYDYLRNIGLSDKQAKLLQEISGINISIYQLAEGRGLRQVE